MDLEEFNALAGYDEDTELEVENDTTPKPAIRDENTISAEEYLDY